MWPSTYDKRLAMSLCLCAEPFTNQYAMLTPAKSTGV
jgi:hypothetical protein